MDNKKLSILLARVFVRTRVQTAKIFFLYFSAIYTTRAISLSSSPVCLVGDLLIMPLLLFGREFSGFPRVVLSGCAFTSPLYAHIIHKCKGDDLLFVGEVLARPNTAGLVIMQLLTLRPVHSAKNTTHSLK